MEFRTITVPPDLFLENYINLKDRLTTPYPLDNVIRKCKNCKNSLFLDENGIVKFDNSLTENIEKELDWYITKLYEDHITESEIGCDSESFGVSIFGLPTNIQMFFPESQEDLVIQKIQLEGSEYQLDLLVKTADEHVVFCLYTNVTRRDGRMKDFILYSIRICLPWLNFV